jgi:hypothetical protein
MEALIDIAPEEPKYRTRDRDPAGATYKWIV